MNKSKALIFSIIAICVIIALSFTFLNEDVPNEQWPVPEKYSKMKNPVSADRESVSVGKTLYNQHCKSCHGKEGLGDGSKAAQLDTPCGDFTSEEFQGQSDGAIFYKTYEGRGDMPGFSKKIPDADDIWSMVNYMRTLE